MSLILLVSGGAGIGWSWWRHHQMQLPPGIAYGQWSVRTRREVRGPHREALRRPRRYRGAGQVVAMIQTEPDKLMFRIRVWIAPERFKGHEAIVRSGLPGIAYVRTEPSVVWAPSPTAEPPPRARRRAVARGGCHASLRQGNCVRRRHARALGWPGGWADRPREPRQHS
jgi:hypothetical protein